MLAFFFNEVLIARQAMRPVLDKTKGPFALCPLYRASGLRR